MYTTISLITRLFTGWMFVVSSMIFIILHTEKVKGSFGFFRVGPSKSLIIFGISIDTYYKYYCLIILCCMNSMFRAIHTSYIQPWIINNVQDSKISVHMKNYNVYEIVIVNTVYIWFDWCMYMNILLSQIDMLMTEIISDIIMTCFVTQYHIYQKCHNNNDLTANYVLHQHV